MTKAIAIVLFLLVVLLVRFAIRFKDKGSSDYLTKINLIGTAIFLFILAIGLLTTDKPFCELFPYFCR